MLPFAAFCCKLALPISRISSRFSRVLAQFCSRFGQALGVKSPPAQLVEPQPEGGILAFNDPSVREIEIPSGKNTLFLALTRFFSLFLSRFLAVLGLISLCLDSKRPRDREGYGGSHGYHGGGRGAQRREGASLYHLSSFDAVFQHHFLSENGITGVSSCCRRRATPRRSATRCRCRRSSVRTRSSQTRG